MTRSTLQEPAAEGRMPVDRPIIFSGPMVRALLDDRKSMTRRLAWRDAVCVPERERASLERRGHLFERRDGECFASAPSRWQRMKPGDQLWVRETWQLHSAASDLATIVYAATINESWTETHNQFPVRLADGLRAPRPFQEGWRSPIHMPRWASRLTLIVTTTKIERLQDISEGDADHEGARSLYGEPFDPNSALTNRRRFELLWRDLHGTGSWDANPECVAISFTVHKTNIAALPNARDSVIAAQRLAEIRDDPAQLIGGDELASRLKAMDGSV